MNAFPEFTALDANATPTEGAVAAVTVFSVQGEVMSA
jgi:hypothetical protein